MDDVLHMDPARSPASDRGDGEPLPPWVVVGGEFYGHRDWRIEAIVGLWIRVIDTKSRSDAPDEAWIYLPTGIVYGSTTLQRRTQHGLPTISR
jgi:hypothetical protein